MVPWDDSDSCSSPRLLQIAGSQRAHAPLLSARPAGDVPWSRARPAMGRSGSWAPSLLIIIARARLILSFLSSGDMSMNTLLNTRHLGPTTYYINDSVLHHLDRTSDFVYIPNPNQSRRPGLGNISETDLRPLTHRLVVHPTFSPVLTLQPSCSAYRCGIVLQMITPRHWPQSRKYTFCERFQVVQLR